MIYDIQKRLHINEGRAIFLPPERCLWNMRKAAKIAALAKQRTKDFVIMHEEMYYPNMLDQLLCDPTQLQKEASALDHAIKGQINGRICCSMLWETSCQGVLLHHDGTMLYCAYVPLISHQTAKLEQEMALRLTALASQAQDISVDISDVMVSGRQSLRIVLQSLSEQLKA